MVEHGDSSRRRREKQTRKSMVISDRTISSKPWVRPPRPPSNPWSVYHQQDGKGSQLFYSVSEQRSYTKNIEELKGRFIINCSQDGWLMIFGSSSHELLLWNPVSMETINLPRLKSETAFSMLTSPPHDDNCFVIFTDKNGYTLYICKIGDSEWTKQVIDSEEYKKIHCMVSGNRGGQTVYALVELVDSEFPYYTLAMFHVAPDLTLRLERIVDRHELPTSIPEPYPYLNTLVNCYEDGIFLVLCREYEGKARRVHSVEVVKMNFSSQEWEIVDTLGGRAFFVNGNGETLWCWAERGIKANCVYFRGGDDPTNLRVFDLEDKSMIFPSTHLSLSLDSAMSNCCWVVTAHKINAKPSRKFSKFPGFRVKNRKLSTLLK